MRSRLPPTCRFLLFRKTHSEISQSSWCSTPKVLSSRSPRTSLCVHSRDLPGRGGQVELGIKVFKPDGLG